MRVGMFDSGIGGLTVLKEFIKKYPINEYFYYGDTANVPYGNKTKEELLVLATRIVKYLESNNVDLIIIACGTVSSNIYNELKEVSKVPIYNIIDSTIEYLNNSSFNSVAILATKATINSHVFKNKVKKQVNEIECPLLVPMIEGNDPNIEATIKEYLSGVEEDAIVLGCTHYPLVADIIKKYSSSRIINMGEILVNKISLTDSQSSINLAFSKVTEDLIKNVKNILK